MEKSALIEMFVLFCFVFKWRNRFYFCQLYTGSQMVFHHLSEEFISFICSFKELDYFFSLFS